MPGLGRSEAGIERRTAGSLPSFSTRLCVFGVETRLGGNISGFSQSSLRRAGDEGVWANGFPLISESARWDRNSESSFGRRRA